MGKKRRLAGVLIFIGLAVFFFWIIINVPSLIYALLESSGIDQEKSFAVTEIIIAIVAVVFTTDGLWGKLAELCKSRADQGNGFRRAYWMFAKFVSEIFEAFPARSILFLEYIIVIAAAYLGIVQNSSEYTFIAIFVIAADRLQAAWKNEKLKLRHHGKNAVDTIIHLSEEQGKKDLT